LNYIREKWGLFLQKYLFQLLSGLDFIKEEQKMVFDGPGPTSVIHFDAAGREDEEAGRFSPDRDWMPNLVLMAKCVYVWLDQLSKKYDRSITTLDQIPDGVNGGGTDYTSDQRGESRPQGVACDVGAFERGAAFYAIWDGTGN